MTLEEAIRIAQAHPGLAVRVHMGDGRVFRLSSDGKGVAVYLRALGDWSPFYDPQFLLGVFSSYPITEVTLEEGVEEAHHP